ncbi:MAG: hypothetical protein CL942_08695 [Desulfovibrio sp.]|nr:hypothetical protein [Desulfovibrio sp.]|tara:strand:- start:16315 stop:16569 length:255 start_codon:yes stop_codon:yes gene_type:complete
MKLTPIQDMNDTRRQTQNQAWPWNAQGLIGSKIAGQALALKGLIQRDMASRTIEEANRICDAIITTAEQVENLEHAPLIGGTHG